VINNVQTIHEPVECGLRNNKDEAGRLSLGDCEFGLSEVDGGQDPLSITQQKAQHKYDEAFTATTFQIHIYSKLL
jgi:hypothetical protein